VEVTVRVNVARSAEEADIQAGKLPPGGGEGEEEPPETEEDILAGL
jgi:hypothetical protein